MPEITFKRLADVKNSRKEKALQEFLATVPTKEGWYTTREIFVIYRDYKLWCELHYPNTPRYLRDELTGKLYARQEKIPMSKL